MLLGSEGSPLGKNTYKVITTVPGFYGLRIVCHSHQISLYGYPITSELKISITSIEGRLPLISMIFAANGKYPQ